jgi:hypothetical protein
MVVVVRRRYGEVLRYKLLGGHRQVLLVVEEGLPVSPSVSSLGYRCNVAGSPFPVSWGPLGLTFSVEITSSPLSLVAMAYRMTRSGSMTVSPFSQRMMMGLSPLAVQFSSFAWPLMAMVVLGWEVIMAGTAEGRRCRGCEGLKATLAQMHRSLVFRCPTPEKPLERVSEGEEQGSGGSVCLALFFLCIHVWGSLPLHPGFLPPCTPLVTPDTSKSVFTCTTKETGYIEI